MYRKFVDPLNIHEPRPALLVINPIEDLLASLRKREEAAWGMASMFLENRDAHGVMDAGSELESLRRAISEIEKLNKVN